MRSVIGSRDDRRGGRLGAKALNELHRLISVCPKRNKSDRGFEPNDLVVKLLGIIPAGKELDAAVCGQRCANLFEVIETSTENYQCK
jgi:hypothetical protein